jgi:mRNA-degrading endonuclease toxin of MazEF toxin-antitoxin module
MELSGPQQVRIRPGEIWWADVPFREGTGSKVRPCVVVRTLLGAVDVLKITTKPRPHSDYVKVDKRSWEKRYRASRSFVGVSVAIRLPAQALRRRIGMIDDATWTLVRARHDIGRA